MGCVAKDTIATVLDLVHQIQIVASVHQDTCALKGQQSQLDVRVGHIKMKPCRLHVKLVLPAIFAMLLMAPVAMDNDCEDGCCCGPQTKVWRNGRQLYILLAFPKSEWKPWH